MDRGAWQVSGLAKSRPQLSVHAHAHTHAHTHTLVCVLSVLPSLAAVIRHRLDFSRTKSQQRLRRWLWGGGTRSPGEEPVSEAPTLLLASIPLPPQASTSMLPSRCLPHLSLRKGELTISPAMSTSFLGDILRAGACPSLGR